MREREKICFHCHNVVEEKEKGSVWLPLERQSSTSKERKKMANVEKEEQTKYYV